MMDYGIFNETTFLEDGTLLESAKFNVSLKKFLAEGEDYKGLKKELKEVIKMNDMSDDELKDKIKTGKGGVMHVCKRIVQIYLDCIFAFNTGSLIGGTIGAATAMPVLLPYIIITQVVGLFLNRVLRLAADTVEFNAVYKDCKTILNEIEDAKSKCKDPKQKKKLEESADKLRKAMDKYM